MRIMKKLMLIPVIGIMVLFSSCSEDGETSTNLVQEFDLESEATIDANYEDVDDIVNAGIESISEGARVEEDELLDGATITHDRDNNIITIDYGTGVEGPGGRIRRGMIIITYSELRWTPGAFRQVTFENFSVDNVAVEGVRRLENTSASTDASPEFTVTLAGGKLTITREVNKVRSWLRAANPRNDEVEVSGNANGSRRDGSTYNVEILEPIVYKRDCRRARVFVPVSGVKQITSGENVAVLDYGDGSCDNLATLTINGGEPEEIVIRLRGRF